VGLIRLLSGDNTLNLYAAERGLSGKVDSFDASAFFLNGRLWRWRESPDGDIRSTLSGDKAQKAQHLHSRFSAQPLLAFLSAPLQRFFYLAYQFTTVVAQALRDPHKSALINQHHISVGSGEVIKNGAQHRSL